MKKALFLWLTVCVWMQSGWVMAESPTKIKFYDGTYAALQWKAKSEKKPYFIDFYTNWCGPCKSMEKYTFTNEELGKYVGSYYLAYQVDAESFMDDGLQIGQKYDVMFFPTVIIFSPEGEVLKRLTGFQSAQTLLTELKKYRTAEPPIPPITTATHPDKPTGDFVTNKPGTPDATSPAVVAPTKPSGDGLYRISLTRQPSTGYGVQIGVFGDYANVLKEMEKMESEDFHKNILVNINSVGGKSVFRVILGPFDTEAQAKEYQENLKKNKAKEGVVVSLEKFK